MINTGYTALSNTGNMASLQAYSTSDSSPKMNAANNANTYANSGVILTLSKQAISLGLASGVARTLASTSTASVLKTGSRGAAVTELQKNLTKLGYDTKGTDGIFGNDTKNAINSALKNIGSGITNSTGSTVSIQKMLDNLKNDTSLGISEDKKTAMLKAAERLLNDNYEPEFVAGVLGNIQNEGTPRVFESSAYKTESKKPPYLAYMDNNFDYQNKFSGKSIQEVGIAAAIDLQNKVKASDYEGKFGLGMIQWTGSRTEGLLASYQKYATSDKPTKEECIMAEVNFMADELADNYAKVYSNWKNGDKSASSAGDIICRQYEIPADTDKQARLRAQNANKIYAVMMR